MQDAATQFSVPFALSARTGAKGPVTMDLSDAPLWTVWAALQEQVPRPARRFDFTPRGALLLTPIVAGRAYATYDTALFQVRTSGLRLSEKSWAMTLAVVADPKIEIAPSSGRVRLTEMVDDEGNNLLDDEIRSSSLYLTMPSLYYSSLSRKRPEKIGKRLVRLRGTISAYAILKRDVWEINLADLPAEKNVIRNGVTEIFTAANVEEEEKKLYNVELTRAIKSLINYRFWNSTQTRLNSIYNYALFSSVQLQCAGSEILSAPHQCRRQLRQRNLFLQLDRPLRAHTGKS